mmetsp:Transcript_20945/g.45261  ORF Transcript_20945/g.45261 Transcript_20945/m.45261 type:complete len:208 (+) Transcript_20945:2471-3094(+)
MIFKNARGSQLLSFPHLVLGEFLLLPNLTFRCVSVGKIKLDASDLASPDIILFLASSSHGIGGFIFLFLLLLLAALSTLRFQVFTSFLVYLSDGQVDLFACNTDDLDEDFLVSFHPVSSSGHVPSFLGELCQVCQTFLLSLGRVDGQENTVLHDTRDLTSVDSVQFDRQWSFMVLHLLRIFPPASTSTPASSSGTWASSPLLLRLFR